jgi:hypothetical protein
MGARKFVRASTELSEAVDFPSLGTSASRKRAFYGRTTSTTWVVLINLPGKTGLPIFDVMVAKIVCSPAVANLTVNFPVPARLPKLTKNVFGEKLAFGSVALNTTVYEPSVKPQLTFRDPATGAPIAILLTGAADGVATTGHNALPGSTYTKVWARLWRPPMSMANKPKNSKHLRNLGRIAVDP